MLLFRRKVTLYLKLAMILLIVAVFCSACSNKKSQQADLTVWTGMNGAELAALKEIAVDYSKETGKKVDIISIPFTELKVKYQIAAPAGQGPDLITAPHDWTGSLVIAGLIEPLNEIDFNVNERKSYFPVTLKSFEYSGKLYGLPIFQETIALIYNEELLKSRGYKTPPRTFDDVIKIAKEFNNKEKGEYGFFFEITNMYFAWPFISGFGSEIFAKIDGEPDAEKIMLESPQTLAGLELLKSLKYEHNLIPDGATADMMGSIFSDGKMPFCINGPWMLANIDPEKAKKYKIIPLPPLKNGNSPRPFVGVLGVMLNKQAKNRLLAVDFMKFINKPENQKKMSLSAGRPPSRKDTLELLKDNYIIVQFSKAAEFGEPMPNLAETAAVWEPMNQALTLIICSGRSPQEVLPVQVNRIKENIKIMRE